MVGRCSFLVDSPCRERHARSCQHQSTRALAWIFLMGKHSCHEAWGYLELGDGHRETPEQLTRISVLLSNFQYLVFPEVAARP